MLNSSYIKGSVKMPLKPHSGRFKLRAINKVKVEWLKNPHIPNKASERLYIEFLDNLLVPYEVKRRFEKELADFIVDYLTLIYDDWLLNGKVTINHMRELINWQLIKDVFTRMNSIADIWSITYRGLIPLLKEINTSQSVHAIPVVKNTNKGMLLLLDVPVPDGQKTLQRLKRLGLINLLLSVGQC